ncbi:MAG: 30S ribosomal protein S5 [Nitrososphaeria archaeon]|nr:30S ribosomal protein S5 [Nitrososphaeria archaeon]NDB50604.1 30S ribosomal protein S5 [Nitrosopumilaceae archaeon]NDB87723.1 30S ribosomal protein S5 [Nitrososphaerota archaeon]NDB45706.1 30S ribosomal protein S5 [Nitrososphaeria archaeon]NDB62367.1 30S ribosomal protein S5 [Nitrosopumilaceae archaeon]
MSQTQQNQRQDRPPRGDRPRGDRPRQNRGPRKEEEAPWVPRTELGKKVAAGVITNMNEIYSQGLRIQEAGIIKKLLPDLKSEVIDVGMVQKMTPNGQQTKFKALVAAGNENGWLGIGQGKSKQMRVAIEKATTNAYLNVNPIKLGCGSWECRCDQSHSVPFKVRGKGGSVVVEIVPAPRGLGLVAGGKIRNLLKLAGLKDAWTTAKGSTETMNSTSKAILECLRQTFSQG